MSETARTQAHRPMEIATPLGDDALLLLGMQGTETLGRLFHFELDLMSETPVEYGDILGKNVTLRLSMRDGKERYFNGDISRFVFVSVDEPNKDNKRLYYYRANMVPRAWFLTRVADSRIFQNMTVPDIIRKIFGERGITDFKATLTGKYQPAVYCVQYRETDFNFISRLMENEGIYYYFEHENGKHTMVLCDAPTAHKPAPGYDNLEFDQPDLKSTHDAYLWNWTLGTDVTPNKYALTDYNPLQPKTDLSAAISVDHGHDPGAYEIFDYPGGYDKPEEGRRYANTRMEEVEAQYVIGQGTSSARGIFAGCTFTLVDHPAFDATEFLITSVTYQLENDDIGGGTGRTGGGVAYQAQVTCIPSKYEFRSQRVTPRPIVQGPQTAVVVGPSGEEIHTNKDGQVKVKFFWDRDSKKDENSSCWLRVSQASAGLSWGAINIPRIGQEVIVDFLEGDPDRPLITGRVYNGVNTPPYALPANQTMTVFKTNSSKGGGGFNEWRFEDKKGSEKIFMFGQKDYHMRIQNDRVETISNDMHLTVENNYFAHIEAKQHVQVDSDSMEQVGADKHVTVAGNQNMDVGGSQSEKIGGNLNEDIGGNHAESVGGELSISADTIILTAGSKIVIQVGGHSICIGSDGIGIVTTGDLKTKSAGQTQMTCGSVMKQTAVAQYKVISPSVKILGASTTVTGASKLTLASEGKVAVEGANVSIQGAMIKLN